MLYYIVIKEVYILLMNNMPYVQKGITRSISRKETPADNAPIECFYAYLKCETFYLNTELKSSNTFVIDIVENYIENHNKIRVQQKLGYLSPIEYRKLAA